MGSDWRGLCAALFARVATDLEQAVADLQVAELNARVAPSTNSIGWIAWHLTRSNDRNVSELAGADQLWVSDGWHAAFGRDPDPADTGLGHSAAEARAFAAPSAEVLLGYHQRVLDIVLGYLRDASPEALEATSHSLTLGNTCTVQDRLVGALRDAQAHIGQILLLCGLLRGGHAPRS